MAKYLYYCEFIDGSSKTFIGVIHAISLAAALKKVKKKKLKDFDESKYDLDIERLRR